MKCIMTSEIAVYKKIGNNEFINESLVPNGSIVTKLYRESDQDTATVQLFL